MDQNPEQKIGSVPAMVYCGILLMLTDYLIDISSPTQGNAGKNAKVGVYLW